MSISDALMLEWFDVLRFGDWEDLLPERESLAAGDGDAMALKQSLAERLVARCHGAAAAAEAREHFERVVQRKELPDEVPEASLELAGREQVGLLDLLRGVGLARSNAEGRRLVQQGGLRLDGEPVRDPALHLSPGTYLVQAGKRRFVRVQVR